MTRTHVPKQYVNPEESWHTGWAPYQPTQQVDLSGVGRSAKDLEDPVAPHTLQQIASDPSGGALTSRMAWEEAEALSKEMNKKGATWGDAIKANVVESVAGTTVGKLVEAWEYANDEANREQWGPQEYSQIETGVWNSMTASERDYIQNAWNRSDAMFRLERIKASRENLEKMGSGSFAQNILAGLIGGFVDNVFGFPGGAAGSALGRMAARGLYGARLAAGETSVAARALLTQRVTGAVSGAVLGGAGAEALAATFDPYHGMEDVAAALLFDQAMLLGGYKGWGGDIAAPKLAAKIKERALNLPVERLKWWKDESLPSATPEASRVSKTQLSIEEAAQVVEERLQAHREEVAQAQAAQKTPEATSVKSPEAPAQPSTGKAPGTSPEPTGDSPKAPEGDTLKAATERLPDLSWATPQELENLKIHTVIDSDGKVRGVAREVNFWELPEGWVDSNGYALIDRKKALQDLFSEDVDNAPTQAPEEPQRAPEGSPDPAPAVGDTGKDRAAWLTRNYQSLPELNDYFSDDLNKWGVHWAVDPQGNKRRVPRDQFKNYWDLPAGWYDMHGNLSQGPVKLPDSLAHRVEHMSTTEARMSNVLKPWENADKIEANEREIAEIRAYAKSAGYSEEQGLGMVATKLGTGYRTGQGRLTGNVFHGLDMHPDVVALMDAVVSEYAPGTKLILLNDKSLALKKAGGVSMATGRDVFAIRINPELTGDALTTVLLHEFGHSYITPNLANIPHKLRGDWTKAVKRVQGLMADPERVGEAIRARFGEGHPLFSKLPRSGVDPKGDPLSLMGLLMKLDDSPTAFEYWASHEEINADQFYRHVTRNYRTLINAANKPNGWKPPRLLTDFIAKLIEPLLGMIKRMTTKDIKALNDGFDRVIFGVRDSYQNRRAREGKLSDALLKHIPDTDPHFGDGVLLRNADASEYYSRDLDIDDRDIPEEAFDAAEKELKSKDLWDSRDEQAKAKSKKRRASRPSDDWLEGEVRDGHPQAIDPKELEADYQITDGDIPGFVREGEQRRAKVTEEQKARVEAAREAKGDQGPREDPTDDFKSALKLSPQAEAYGLSTDAIATPADAAGLIMMDRVIQRALQEAPPPVQDIRRSQLLGRQGFRDASGDLFISASQIAHSSNNPVVRWVAARFAESPSNITGERQHTAALDRFMMEREVLGGDLMEARHAQDAWMREKGYHRLKNLLSGKAAGEFNQRMQQLMYETHINQAIPDHATPAERRFLEAAERVHRRANEMERKYSLPGTEAETPPALGYQQRILDPTKVAQLTKAQKEKLIGAIRDQLLAADWSPTVAKRVATRYLDRAEKARAGIFTPQRPMLENEDAIQSIQAILREEGYDQGQVEALTGPLLRQKQKHFHRKLALDENMDLGDGVTLGSLLWNDHLALLRDRARATAGWSAMAKHGVHGYEGMRAIMAAAAKGSGDILATPSELRAIEQILSEVSSVPLAENAGYYNKILEGATATTAVLRLGSLGWTQAFEYFNIGAHVGLDNALKSIGSYWKLRKELLDILAGKASQNPYLSEIEAATGTTFGTDGYFMASPWDTEGRNRDIRGSEETSGFIRSINAIGHIQGAIGGHRAISAVQARTAAEVTVEQVLNRIPKMDQPDTWMKDIGIQGELFDYLKQNVDNLVDRHPDGKVKLFRARDMDPEMLSQLSGTIFRSVNQMIQGSFAGERGRYVHDSFWRAATQFRAYSMTALEKQLGRQVGNYGYAKAALMMATSTAAAIPLVMLRTYVASLGRSDQKEYLERHLSPLEIIQKASNYIATSGFTSDLIDAFQDLTGQNTTGNDLIGQRFFPSVQLANDAYKAVRLWDHQGRQKFLNMVPGSTLPYMVPVIGAIKDAEKEWSKDDEK